MAPNYLRFDGAHKIYNAHTTNLELDFRSGFLKSGCK
jgi:hypothetical protein